MTVDHVWQISIPAHSETGLRFTWGANCRLRVLLLGTEEVVIEGNAEGLETLARHLLTLAQPDVPSGMHLHLEDSFGLMTGSLNLVLEREDDLEDSNGLEPGSMIVRERWDDLGDSYGIEPGSPTFLSNLWTTLRRTTRR